MKIVILNFSTHINLSKDLDSVLRKGFIESEITERQFFNVEHLPELSNKDIVWINTASRNLNSIDEDYLEFLWSHLKNIGCYIVQNNFEFCKHTKTRNDINELNSFIDSKKNDKFFVLDLNFVSSMVGLKNWYNEKFWYAYKFPYDHKHEKAVINKFTNIVFKIKNKIKKCIVLDLDNTLWHGVIGDDGLEKIKLSREDAIGEAYNDFHIYLKKLMDKGILLAVCSKNEYNTAKKGFTHPDSVLKYDDFAAFEANWKPKHINLVNISKQLNIGLDSFVFIDDNPAEREIIRINLPEVSVPELGSDITTFIDSIEECEYFKADNITREDKRRVKLYKENFKRNLEKRNFKDYGEFLKSLEMCTEIDEFKEIYFERLSQLSKRTNQFNLTTKRYNISEIKELSNSKKHVTLYGRLKDKFGDNGLVTAIIGKIEKDVLLIDLWIMSCRVFDRELEYAMFDRLLQKCQKNSIKEIVGIYKKTNKNAFVENLYKKIGFELKQKTESESTWSYKLSKSIQLKNKFLEINSESS